MCDGFDRLPDSIAPRGLGGTDGLRSALAMFRLQSPLRLGFEPDARDADPIRSNLSNGSGGIRAPSESAMRERLDPVDPRSVRRAFQPVVAALQRGPGWVGFPWLGDPLLSVDGTGLFSSRQGHCDPGGEPPHRDGSPTGHPPRRGAVGGHPAPREGLPLAPEPTRREPPHRKLLVGEDALASNGPSIRELEERGRRSVLEGKPGDPGEGFRWVDVTAATRPVERTRSGRPFRFRCLNGGPLNDANVDGEGNRLAGWEVRPDGRTGPFSWVTDREVTDSHADPLRRAGRARWQSRTNPSTP